MPVQTRLVRRDEWQSPVDVGWLGNELILFPLCVVGDHLVTGAGDDQFVSFLADITKRAIGIYQVQAVVGSVHDLVLGDKVHDYRDAQPDQDAKHNEMKIILGLGEWKFILFRPVSRCYQFFWQDQLEQVVVQQEQGRYQSNPVKKGVVTGHYQDRLEAKKYQAGCDSQHPGIEHEESRENLQELGKHHSEFQYELRQEMHERTQRVRDWLGLEMVIQAGEILPAFRSPELDQPGSEIKAEQKPAYQPNEG